MKPLKTVDLSVMWANGPKLPDRVALADCKATNFFTHEGWLSGFYGFHARGLGLQYCAMEADSRRAKIIPVTLSIRLEREISSRMVTMEVLRDVDMLNVARASRALINVMAEFWYARLKEKGWNDQYLANINWRLTEKFMHMDESLVTELLALPEFNHLRLFVYPAIPVLNPGMITTPISLGVTKSEFVVSAMSPMFPSMPVET